MTHRRKTEHLFDQLERLMRELVPWPSGGPGAGTSPTVPPGCPPVVLSETVEVLVKLGMAKPVAVRRAHAASHAVGSPSTTIQDMINAVFAQPKEVNASSEQFGP